MLITFKIRNEDVKENSRLRHWCLKVRMLNVWNLFMAYGVQKGKDKWPLVYVLSKSDCETRLIFMYYKNYVVVYSTKYLLLRHLYSKWFWGANPLFSLLQLSLLFHSDINFRTKHWLCDDLYFEYHSSLVTNLIIGKENIWYCPFLCFVYQVCYYRN